MRLALLLLLAAAPDDDRALRFFEKIKFEKTEAQGDEGRRVMEMLLKKEHWVGAYRTLEEKFGKFPDDLELAVDFDLDGKNLGSARCADARGRISFNLKRLVEGTKRLDEFERLKREAKA